MRFFKSFFSGKADTPEAEKRKAEQKNFEIFKYDGMRAQRMGRLDYAIKCFHEALKLQKDFETMGYLAQILIQTNAMDEARSLLTRMTEKEPSYVNSYLTLANVCYMQEDYPAMADAARKAIDIEPDNASAHFLLGRATHRGGDVLMSIAHLTKAIALKEDFTEARLLRAEVLISLNQYKEATEDLDAVLAQSPDEESALLLHGRLSECTGDATAAEEAYRHIITDNPFNEQAFIALGKLYIEQKKLPEAIELLDEAVDLNPNCAQAYHERGRAKLLNGDKEGATEDMKHSLELNPKEAERLNGAFNNQPLTPKTDILGL